MLEQGPLVGAGAVVKAPEGAGGWEFETGVQCLGGGDKLARFVKRLQLACLPAGKDGGSAKGENEGLGKKEGVRAGGRGGIWRGGGGRGWSGVMWLHW